MSKLSTTNNGASKSNTVLAYARVSSKEQDMEGFSIAAQQKLLQAYASGNGLIIEKEFIDVETAKASGRLNFNEMVNYLKKHPGIRTLLVEKTDRLYRNLKDWVLLDELNIEIHLVKEGVVLSQDSKSSEKFFHGIKVLMAKNYIDNLSEEARKGQRKRSRASGRPRPRSAISTYWARTASALSRPIPPSHPSSPRYSNGTRRASSRLRKLPTRRKRRAFCIGGRVPPFL
jgi:DNA invertase Pin-like site-specific DNA recombinase